jgi:hypothetical protein
MSIAKNWPLFLLITGLRGKQWVRQLLKRTGLLQLPDPHPKLYFLHLLQWPYV